MNKQLFKGALLETILLSLLDEKEEQGLHGYAFILLLRKRYGVYMSASKIYPELKLMEEKDLASSSWIMHGERPRNVYKITKKGKKLLTEYYKQLKIIVPSLEEIWKKTL